MLKQKIEARLSSGGSEEGNATIHSYNLNESSLHESAGNLDVETFTRLVKSLPQTEDGINRLILRSDKGHTPAMAAYFALAAAIGDADLENHPLTKSLEVICNLCIEKAVDVMGGSNDLLEDENVSGMISGFYLWQL